MSNKKIVQAWKSEEFRNSLSAAEQAMIPENPAGFIELSCDELVAVNGSDGQPPLTSLVCIMDALKITTVKDAFCDGEKRGNLGLAVRS